MKNRLKLLFALIFISGFAQSQTVLPIFKSDLFTLYPDKVIQGKFIGQAISSTQLSSNYRSPANLFKSPVIEFKLSINGKDNEMPAGVNHFFICTSQINQTPLIKFGERGAGYKKPLKVTYLKSATEFKIRVDMRDVLKAFNDQGYYTCFNGDKIYKSDFKGLFVAGNTAPMIWDFNNLVNHPELALKDTHGDGIYETTLILNKPEDESKIESSWKLSKDLSAFPQYQSQYPISDALYNLSLEEMEKAIEPDSTFRTGKEWGGVWTRDISYSILLSMAVLQPKVAMYSLVKKVKDGHIIQDTGTGGAYPVSSDRMVWALAAFEVYKVTGDEDWLKKAFTIIKNSAADDVYNLYDHTTGLVRGESSFLDWREETYPRWMQPADIYESECLGTNVVHYQVNKVLASMAKLLNDTSQQTYLNRAEIIKKGISDHLWQPQKGYYGQYLYGRNFKTMSPRSEALGEALAVLFDVTDLETQKKVISSAPVNNFGIPCIYPQIPGILPYHNKAVWPFVETFWAMAAAKAGNENALIRAIAAIYRPAGLFLTNKENFVVSDGDYAGTQINSSNMLWSLSGNIALIYKVLFGMHYNENNLVFKPFVPSVLNGNRTLLHFNYRNAVLNITLKGSGNIIKEFYIDGKPIRSNSVSADLSGTHDVRIILANNPIFTKSNLQPDYTAPETPDVTLKDNKLSWLPIAKAVEYEVIKNGKLLQTVKTTNFTIPVDEYGEYQVAAVDLAGIASFYSEPKSNIPASLVDITEAETAASKSDLTYAGFSGSGFVEISKTVNTSISFTCNVKESGIYAIDFRYANGNGPINTENKCAIRTLTIDDNFGGTIVFPQRGKGEWSDWGFSNSVKVKLQSGQHTIKLQFKDANENMNGEINQAMLDYLRLIKISAN